MYLKNYPESIWILNDYQAKNQNITDISSISYHLVKKSKIMLKYSVRLMIFFILVYSKLYLNLYNNSF
jgi:hypothetical protein